MNKIKLNPTKNFYVNKEDKFIRMGNFPQTGRMIEYENENFIQFLSFLKEYVDYDNVILQLLNKFNMKKSDAENLILYLLENSILIEDTCMLQIEQDEFYNRELNYFLMISNKNKISEFKEMQNKKICILGMGGIGSIIAEMLVRAGFNKLILLDYDNIEKSNLIRQTLYFEKDVGQKKTVLAKKNLLKINSNIQVDTYDIFITKEEDIDLIVKNSDFIISSVDKPARLIRHIVNKVCVKNLKPVLFTGFAEHYGMVGPFIVPNKTACLECINNTETTELFKMSDNVPSFGPLCSIIANIAVSEIINYFINYKDDTLIGKTLMFDMLTYKTEIKEWIKKEDCKTCGGIK